MSEAKIDMTGMEEHYIIVDHTDNSGLSVHKPTEKDIKLFKIYGTMECGNTTHVIPYRDFKQLKEKLEKVTKIAEEGFRLIGCSYARPSDMMNLARLKQKKLKEILNP